MKVWDGADGGLIATLMGHSGGVRCGAFVTNDTVVSGSGGSHTSLSLFPFPSSSFLFTRCVCTSNRLFPIPSPPLHSFLVDANRSMN